MSQAERYRECVRKMTAAALEFCSTHAGRFALSLPPTDAVLIFPLTTAVAVALLARDETARRFINHLAEATRNNGGGTVEQLCYVVRALEIPHTQWTPAELEEFARNASVRTVVSGARATRGGSA